MYKYTLPLPPLLLEMLNTGRWPKNSEEASTQQYEAQWVPRAQVSAFCLRDAIYLLSPPFLTVRESALANPSYWLAANNGMGAARGLDMDLAIDLAEFEIGDDSSLVLDYRNSMERPQVLCNYWKAIPEKRGSSVLSDSLVPIWQVVAPDFPTMVKQLGL
ncbi:MAG: hypothetical protein ACE366_23885 [Bradymonadia bacterium]